MKRTGKLAVRVAGATSLALLLTSSAFADSRRQNETYRRDRQSQSAPSQSYSYRENQRVTEQGRVTSFTHERGGYRVQLDRARSPFWVPESYVRTRGLRVGINIALGGVFRAGSIYVDDVNWPADGSYGYGYGYGYDGYSDGYVRGVVDRVDYRRATVWLRDDRSGRLVEIDMRGNRRGRLNIDDLRRGDYVELSGNWVRGDIFDAYRIESVRSGRY